MNGINDILQSHINDIMPEEENASGQTEKDTGLPSTIAQEENEFVTSVPISAETETPTAILDESISIKTETLNQTQTQAQTVGNYISQIENLLFKLKTVLGEKNEQVVSNISDFSNSSNPPLPDTPDNLIPKTHSPVFTTTESSADIHEGVFNGEGMVGHDGKSYPIPPNYASKSKLVEGDLLKVTVTINGTLIFKQIGPIERDRRVGELVLEEDGTYRVICENSPYRVLTAAITYHKGRAGQQVVVLTPKDAPSKWAAVEYFINEE